MRVVLDTNVFVSGIFFTGPPHQILEGWRDGKVQLLVSPPILEEYHRVGMELVSHFQDIDLKPFLDLLFIHAEIILALESNLHSDERNPERKSLTESFFKEIGDYEIFVSEITVAEIERTPEPVLQIRMKEAMFPFSILALTEDVEHLAKEYIRHMAIPEGYPEDAYHNCYCCRKRYGFSLKLEF